ncbi:hypothetical protein CC1G_02771 [Coprinopsis cinerea okayama7|uniref:Uncharacterized protein n=1 Tax=Coprinopsis cinerea (strain Okayama-7 / 130 / ATCC MYA-4618 / FGSC 9003) TaxID=240176 RepID=A8N000_COPC7|nr:hypothetical protein CC1G_02771 [Coprinopsis cinerea okayama7\|eukprot:XP_001828190.2 hypothetical protein CC1G_02771 [Coprinopsis cinerea okayama7\
MSTPLAQSSSFDRTLYRSQYQLGPLLTKAFEYAFYALSLIDHMTDPEPPEAPPDVRSDIPLLIRSELQQAANQVHEGLKHALRLPWSLEEFQEAHAECGNDEQELLRRCPPPPHPPNTPHHQATAHYMPTFFIDKNGRVVFAYLPAILRASRWENLFKAAFPIFTPTTDEHRNFLDYSFRSFKSSSFSLPSGGVRLYPAATTSFRFPTVHYPEPAVAFKRADIRPHAFKLLESIEPDTFGILAAVLAMINPDHFHAALEVLEGLHIGTIWSGDKTLREEVMKRWGFPFTCVDFLSNLLYPCWERSDYRPHDLALYVSLGNTSLPLFRVPGLERQFHFDSGTICVGFPHILPITWCSKNDDDHLVVVGSFMDLRFATSRLVRKPTPMGTTEYTAYLDYIFRNETPLM